MRPRAILATALALGAGVAILAPSVAAAAPRSEPTTVAHYDDYAMGPDAFGAFGQTFSPARKCLANRRMKVVVLQGSDRVVWDRMRTSSDGAWAAYGPTAPFLEATGVRVVVAKRVFRRGGEAKLVCRRGSFGLTAPRVAAAERQLESSNRRRATASTVRALTVDGAGDDGALAGLVESTKDECVRGRTVRIFGFYDGERRLLDVARSSHGGAWAGHVTGREDAETSRYLAVLKRKTYRRGGKKRVCAGDRDSYGRTVVPLRTRGAW